MKELVGKIYKDETGQEFIERISPVKNLWIVEIFEEENCVNKDLRYAHSFTCPYCNHKYKYWNHSIAERINSVKNFREGKREGFLYCGHCGAHLIIK